MLDDLRRPEYTGENRCWPCTASNAVLLLLACASVARLLPAKRARRLGVASVLGLVGGATIALRGYLVPGTPRFAPRLVDVLAGEPTRPTEAGSLAGEAADDAGERALDALLAEGVVHAVGDSLHLDERFRSDWRAAMRRVRERDLAPAVSDAAPVPVDVELVEGGDWVVVSAGGPESERWLSRPVAIAEVAAVRALAESGVDPAVRAQSASPLRAFLRECPDCDVELEETTADRCCGSGTSPLSPPDEVLACPACDRYVFRF
ncbi:hypothetical protein [Haladaptatus salinisoli]|uniref:hypothetical protein n=1 Tax=Haladaptatus salinisoli TaxID=2884876 RepID=UPI001D0AE07B|nr:hypothetical protein [Haladaptatus salinisoli]